MTPAIRVPWLPGTLQEKKLTVDDARRLSYIVVDDIMDDTVTLAVHPWPVADEDGRVRFVDLNACQHATVSLREMETQIYRRRRLRREPRVGDVFGAVVNDAAKRVLSKREDTTSELSSLLTPPIYDLSRDARVAAKLAYYAAMTPLLAEEEMLRWNLAEKEEPPLGKAKKQPHSGPQIRSLPHA